MMDVSALWRVGAALIAVLAVIYAMGWLTRRLGVTPRRAGEGLRIVGRIRLSARASVLVIDVDDERFVLGTGPGGVSLLSKRRHPTDTPATRLSPDTAAGPRTGRPFADVIAEKLLAGARRMRR
ncbi:MAG: flagellar biosynthetic protein FliO [Candidimonas sp.]|nr:MAG: flagellar biosynthetic protein FliO [Candidimonas sp.]